VAQSASTINVQQRAGELTTSVTYDRAGTGWSDSVDLPRASVEITDELRALLRVAEVPAPYVMVEVRHAGRMPDVPVIILTSMGIDSFKAAVSQGIPESLLREEIEGKRRLYTIWAHALHGEIRLIEDVGHATLHFRRPDAVLQAIQDLLDRLDEQWE
jgi:hypothetical protein